MNRPTFEIRLADWPTEQSLLRWVREKVFIEEQQVPKELEWDGEDDKAVHVLALDSDDNPIGTARLLPTGQIGRMAVLQEWRRRGVGSALLQRLLAEAALSDYPDLYLNAQTSALPFYAQLGFQAEGEIFYEADIPHRRMTRTDQNG